MAGRLFELRRGDVVVADGVEFPDDAVAIRWRGDHSSTVAWASLEDVEAVSCSDGATRVVWCEP